MLTTTTLAEESPSPDVTGTDSAALLVDDNEEHNSLGGEPTNELPTQPGRILNEVLNRRAILFEEAQRRAAAMSRATVPIDRMLQAQITAMSRATVPIDRMLQAQITAMGRATAPIDRMLQAQIRWADPFAAARKKGERLTKHGWFPHYTIPEALLDEGIDDSDFNSLLLSYYRDNWAQVRQTIEGNLSAYPVDDETKAAFLEALNAHEHGLYRSVCRNLMTEVEHVVRIHLFGGKVGSFSVKKQIGDDFGILPVSMLPDASVGFVGYLCLQEHLYDHIKSEGDRSRIVDHPVPNRHAAIHGLLTYPTVQNSLNSIFVVEYVLQLMSARSAFYRVAATQWQRPASVP